MNESQLSDHLMTDDRHADHAWPDYLDYLEEWNDLFEHKLSLTRKDFIYTVLARRNTRIICGSHFHTFSTTCPSQDLAQDVDEYVIITKPDDYLDVTSCWYKTILAMDKITSFTDTSKTSITLSTIEHESLKRLAALRMTTDEGMVHLQLSFDDFKRMWWSRESKLTAEAILKQSKPLLNIQSELSAPSQAIINEAVQSLVVDPISLVHPPKKAYLTSSSSQVVIQTADQCISDHGLHMALLASEVPKNVLNSINEIRLSADGAYISPQKLAKAMLKCKLCLDLQVKPCFTSPGLFYAPPGSGKTTAITNRLFIGIDTDWLIAGSTFETIVAPFLRQNIPVLTNMHNVCSCSGEKMFGYYNVHNLRRDANGKYYTNPNELQRMPTVYQDDICLSHSDRGYFSHHILRLYRENYLYNTTRKQFYDKTPKQSFKVIDHRPSPLESLTNSMKNWRPRRSRGRHFGLAPPEYEPG